MDQLMQCPVCTLFLHNGMSLESHLDTHPKDQVIKALCSIANKSSCTSSRTSTPAHSERSYGSRSQTPVGDDTGRWSGSHRTSEQERYWSRTPGGSSRAPSRTPSRTPSRAHCRTPRSTSWATASRNCTPDIRTSDNTTYETTTTSPQPSSHSGSNYANHPLSLKADKTQQTYPTPVSDYDQKYPFYPEQQEDREVKYSRSAEYMDVNNVFSYNVPMVGPPTVKMQPNVIPHVDRKRTDPIKILPKSGNLLNIVNNNISGMQYLSPSKQMHVVVNPSAPTFLQKNVHNSMIMTGGLSGAALPRDSKAPLVQNHFNQLSSGFAPGTTVVTQNSQYFYQEMVQNIDPKGFIPNIPSVLGQENAANVAQSGSIYQNVMLVDQFGNASCVYPQPHTTAKRAPPHFPETSTIVTNPQKPPSDATEQNKTLVIEVTPIAPPPAAGAVAPPRQVSAIVSNFTLPKAEASTPEKVEASEPPARGLKILSNIKVEVPVQHTKSMINTVMDLTGAAERSSPERRSEHKMDMELSDSCPVPDLICNERPSASPASDLSDGEERAPEPPRDSKPFRGAPLRLNNIYVKKTKRVLQIKNLKPSKESSSAPDDATPSTSAFAPVRKTEAETDGETSTLKTISIEEIGGKEAAGAERRDSPAALHVKEELSSGAEGAAPGPAADLAAPEYGGASPAHFDSDSGHRELLELEASKSKFASMMGDGYFGDNVYEHYFSGERAATPEPGKEGFCGLWGEPSDREPEFVLPTFIHDGEGALYASERDAARADRERERDSKAALLGAARDEPPRDDSSADLDSSWNGTYSEATPTEPYDLMARESWVSDGSDLDTTEKQDTLEEIPVFPTARQFAGAAAEPAAASTSYTPALIKKEEKEENVTSCSANNLMAVDSKETLTSSILRVYDSIVAAPGLDLRSLLQDTKRRRRDFVCPTCKVDQVTDAAFHAHLRVHPLECLKCGKCFTRRANLTLHLKTHAGIKNYKCEICPKRFLTRQKLSEHHNTHSGRAPVKCTLCDDTFRRYSNMVQHRNRHHFNKRAAVRDYVCECGLVVHSRAKLAWHRETHAPRPHACTHCPDKFVHAASLTRHIRRKHNSLYVTSTASKAENVSCPICKQMYLRSNLRAHLQTHSGKRPYSCVICNKAFTTKWNLKLHRWTHVSRSAKPFRCTLCKGAFVRKTEYIAHMNSHKSVRPYTCNYCGCKFIRKYNCQRHVKEHETAKKYVCEVPDCGKSFHRSYYLSEHMKVHSGARPFACNICGKTSSNKSNHNKHVKIHHARESVATET